MLNCSPQSSLPVPWPFWELRGCTAGDITLFKERAGVARSAQIIPAVKQNLIKVESFFFSLRLCHGVFLQSENYKLRTKRTHCCGKQCRRIYNGDFCVAKRLLGSAPNPFDLHFSMQATPPCGMLLRMSIVTSYEKACTFLAQGSIEEFDGSCYNSRRCVLCGLHTNKVKRSYWTWIRFICCPVRNAALIFEMLMVSRKYTTLTAPSVANFSTAPAAQRPKLSGCVKIGS